MKNKFLYQIVVLFIILMGRSISQEVLIEGLERQLEHMYELKGQLKALLDPNVDLGMLKDIGADHPDVVFYRPSDVELVTWTELEGNDYSVLKECMPKSTRTWGAELLDIWKLPKVENPLVAQPIYQVTTKASPIHFLPSWRYDWQSLVWSGVKCEHSSVWKMNATLHGLDADKDVLTRFYSFGHKDGPMYKMADASKIMDFENALWRRLGQRSSDILIRSRVAKDSMQEDCIMKKELDRLIQKKLVVDEDIVKYEEKYPSFSIFQQRQVEWLKELEKQKEELKWQRRELPRQKAKFELQKEELAREIAEFELQKEELAQEKAAIIEKK